VPTYVWNCEQCGEIEVFRSMSDYQIPPDHAHPVSRVISPCVGFGDITPYIAVGGDMAGKPITTRQEHKRFLKRNRLVELGTDPVKDTSQFRKVHAKGEVARDIQRAVREVRHGR
jgi:hypothetical protein